MYEIEWMGDAQTSIEKKVANWIGLLVRVTETEELTDVAKVGEK
jgi:hypothetical protein